MRMSRKFWFVYISSIILLSTAMIMTYRFTKIDNGPHSRATPDKVEKTAEDSSRPKHNINTDNNTLVSIPVAPESKPSNFNFKWDIISSNKLVKNFVRNDKISFSNPEQYTEVDGITCFRGNNYRNSASFGHADILEQKLEKVWNIKISYIDSWTGVGWNGQPAVIKWDEDIKSIMNLFPDKKTKNNLKEVIYATLDGKIYFLDLEDGTSTREPIDVGYPHKGSITVDPRGYPLLYAGQGIDEISGKGREIGYRIFSLIDQKKLFFINGYDHYALRRWGAFDSTGLIDKKSDTLIECGENGILYSVKLNTQFNRDKGTIAINPNITKYRYRSPKKGTLGTENSVAIYKNYAYFADNSGTFQCIDLNTLTPVWIRDVTDDTDSTTAIDEISDSEVYLYTACETDKQGSGGFSYIRKINALTGKLVWEKSYKCMFDSQTNGGTLASPVVGKNEIANLVIYNIAKTGTKGGGKLVALDKKSGNEVWVVDLQSYCWSSPVDVYNKDGKAYLIVCDSAGRMMLYEAKTGQLLDTISLEANIEGSPAIYNDMIVVGTRGQKIWGIKIK